ncbi:MAG: TIGR03915 family putative DNA repair protein [Clostridiales Family XIII bacterium]|jgi:probable DNA metabolism protein|nr:TIGR03915 family putative DNA repair protein [Clostridiales Family XIII bacterium]
MNYLYDGSFEGFLTCVYEHYYTERADGIFPEGAYQLDMTVRAMSVLSDEVKVQKVSGAIVSKISKYDMERIYRVFRTNEPDKEMKLLRYIVLGFGVARSGRNGGSIRLLHGNQTVLDVQKAEQRIGFEVHRLCGLIRFSAVRVDHPSQFVATQSGSGNKGGVVESGMMVAHGGNEILYARIDPDNDVLEFLAEHFSDRYKRNPFIIHDTKRGKALVSFNREWFITDFSSGDLLVDTDSEQDYQRLWKLYHEIMATKERTNPKCQKNFMPVRYWKNLTELQTFNLG